MFYFDSDEFTCDSEGEDEDVSYQHDRCMEEMRCKDEIVDLVNFYHNVDTFNISTDEYVIWSCASGAVWNGPIYSDEPTENNTVVVLENAQYTNIKTPSLSYMMNYVHSTMDNNQKETFEQELEYDISGGIVSFIKDALSICNIEQSEYNVYRFLYEMNQRL